MAWNSFPSLDQLGSSDSICCLFRKHQWGKEHVHRGTSAPRSHLKQSCYDVGETSVQQKQWAKETDPGGGNGSWSKGARAGEDLWYLTYSQLELGKWKHHSQPWVLNHIFVFTPFCSLFHSCVFVGMRVRNSLLHANACIHMQTHVFTHSYRSACPSPFIKLQSSNQRAETPPCDFTDYSHLLNNKMANSQRCWSE